MPKAAAHFQRFFVLFECDALAAHFVALHGLNGAEVDDG